jgi:hypothetical protein
MDPLIKDSLSASLPHDVTTTTASSSHFMAGDILAPFSASSDSFSTSSVPYELSDIISPDSDMIIPEVAPTHKYCGAQLSDSNKANIVYLDSLIEEIPLPSGKVRLLVRCPQLESAVVNPVRNPKAETTANANLIKAVKLEEMAEYGHVELTNSKNCFFIEQVVPVVKKPNEPRITYDPADHEGSIKRIRDGHRLTLYARRANSLLAIICPLSGVIKHMVPTLNMLKTSSTTFESQYQSSGFESLTMIPSSAMQWFSKIDIKDGFQSILLPEAMRRFFTTCVYDPLQNHTQYYRWCTWPQGYIYSSMAFRNAITHVLEKVCSNATILPMMQSRQLGFGNMMDDVIVAASTFEQCSAALQTLIQFLENHSFRINHAKTVLPCQKLVFCGYEITPQGIKPQPNRRGITDAFAAEMLAQLTSSIKNRKAVATWCRSIAGTFQYYRKFLTGNEFLELQTFYDLCKRVERDENYSITTADIELAKTSLEYLTNYVVNGCPYLYMSSMLHETIASIIVNDGNVESWSGILFRVVRSEHPVCEDDLRYLPEMQPLIQTLAAQPAIRLPEHFSILPTMISGGIWSTNIDRARSSTARERVAQMYCVHDMRPFLSGLVYVVSDNSNSRWDVIDPITQYGGAMMPYWLLFCQEVAGTLWLPRTSIPALADLLARVLERRHISDRTHLQASALSLESSNHTDIPAPLDLDQTIPVILEDQPAILDPSTLLKTELINA